LHPLSPHPSGATATAFVLFDVLLAVFLARVLGNAANRLRQPRVVGEILAGILLGPSLIGSGLSEYIAPVEVRPAISVVATLALVLFMFLVGLEFDAAAVRGREGEAVTLGLSSVAVPAVVGFSVAMVMHGPRYAGPAGESIIPYGLFVGACLSVTALPVIAHLLLERGELNGRIGGISVAAAAVASVAMFTFIGLVSAVIDARSYRPFLVKLALIVAAGVVARFALRPVLRRWLHRNWVVGEGLSADGMAIVFGGLLLSALLADRLGVNAMVGAFAWGVVMPADPELRVALARRLADVATVVLLPVFFVYSGLLTDLRLLSPSVIPVLGLVLVAGVVSKFVAAAPARAFGMSWRETAAVGALMNTRGLVLLVVGLIGLDLRVITPAAFSIFVLVALATNIMTVPLLDALVPGSGIAATPEVPREPLGRAG
jgi:K+:H+ antiporter